MNGAALRSLVLVVALVSACDDDVCEEPDERGSGQEGDPCITIRDCVAGLTCIGTDFEADALCSSPSLLPDETDPGCIDTPDEWLADEARGIEPSGADEEGCDLLIFVTGCDCVELPSGEGCYPVQPHFRRETWRRCNDCCWRLAAYWEDESVCEPPEP